jgi:hypothetical protein
MHPSKVSLIRWVILSLLYKLKNLMKVTAIIPDELVKDLKRITKGTNINESIIIALQSFAAKQKLLEVMEKVRKEPLVFQEGFTAAKVRKTNRKV